MTTALLPRNRRRLSLPVLVLPFAAFGVVAALTSRSPGLALGSSVIAVLAAARLKSTRTPTFDLPAQPFHVVASQATYERVRLDPPIPRTITLHRDDRPTTTADDVRCALDNDELHVVYQPKVTMPSAIAGSGSVVTGVEALVRWWHRDRGPIPPAELVSVAERAGLDAELFDYVLERAAAQVAAWHRLHIPIDVAVNVSASRLIDRDLPENIEKKLAITGLATTSLVLEVTEGQMLPDDPGAMIVVERLRKLGVRLSIDDFGTGYSSLIQLSKLPFDEVKIDRSFVSTVVNDEMSSAIVSSVIELGERLGLSVVAEGVEDQAVWDRLIALGCRSAQGFFVCEPGPAGLVEPWLRSHPVRRARLPVAVGG